MRIGSTRIEYAPTSSILTKASGFMGDYDFTLNPYSGCSFGCTYCYAAFFARDKALQDDWGNWVKVKENAVGVLRRMRTDLRGKSIYMSSVTDPYQPVDRRLGLTRQLLVELVRHQPRLVVQTRSALVTRDIDVLGQFERVRVNMTITTDDEDVRRAFEPQCTPVRARLAAIAEVGAAGIDAGVTMTPLLPVRDAEGFGRLLAETGVRRFVAQPFHADRGRFVAGTRAEAMRIIQEHGWDDARYRSTVEELRRHLPQLDEGRAGFGPP